MTSCIRVGIVDDFLTGNHGWLAMAALIQGIESKSGSVRNVGAEEIDLNGDGQKEFIQKLDVTGDGVADIELVGIHVKGNENLDPNDVKARLTDIEKGAFGKFDYLNCSFNNSFKIDNPEIAEWLKKWVSLPPQSVSSPEISATYLKNTTKFLKKWVSVPPNLPKTIPSPNSKVVTHLKTIAAKGTCIVQAADNTAETNYTLSQGLSPNLVVVSDDKRYGSTCDVSQGAHLITNMNPDGMDTSLKDPFKALLTLQGSNDGSNEIVFTPSVPKSIRGASQAIVATGNSFGAPRYLGKRLMGEHFQTELCKGLPILEPGNQQNRDFVSILQEEVGLTRPKKRPIHDLLHPHELPLFPGINDPKTTNFIKIFQKKHHLQSNGTIDAKTWQALLKAYPNLEPRFREVRSFAENVPD